jgi:hypothetical protein
VPINKLRKIHMRPSGDMSPFQYEYAKLDANVCGSGMNAELRTTCRGRASILGPRQLTHKQTGFWHWVIFSRCRPCVRVTQAMVTAPRYWVNYSLAGLHQVAVGEHLSGGTD